MINPRKFVTTLYYGDSACIGIEIDTWKRSVVFIIDCIARARGTGLPFYEDDPIDNARIVFTDIESLAFTPSGWIPNDIVYYIGVRETGEIDADAEPFYLEIGAGGKTLKDHALVNIDVVAKGVHMEDLARPGLKITE